MSRRLGLVAAVVFLALAPTSAAAERVRVAVASNFVTTAETLAEHFAEGSEHEVALSPGSTGKHYAQIRHGAPYDIFLAADRERPERLENEGLAANGSRFTYAVGRLVLWSRQEALVDPEGRVLAGDGFRHLAIANPDLAPYGSAARTALTRLGYWDQLSTRLVRGENVGQALQFVASGNAEIGLVARAQLRQWGDRGGSSWPVPADLHPPIEQQVVLLSDSSGARAFLDYLRTDEARQIIHDAGYDLP